MSHGRIGRASRRYPDAKRRGARYGNTRYGKRTTTLPPHLLPGAVAREKKGGGFLTPGRVVVMAATAALIALVGFVIITIISAAIGVTGTIRAYRDVNTSLPNAAEVAVDTFQTTRIFDRNGTLLQEVDNPNYGWRTYTPIDRMSEDFINATVASEDSTFWTNNGVEPFAILRGGFIIFSGAGSSGGSTITQQLVRSIYPDQISALDVSLTRKGREALAAYALSERYSKTDILTMYVNQIYYGARAYGIEAAAQTFFNKHASELTLGESAMLAGLPQAPSFYDPTTEENFPIAKRRQQYVLDQMVKYRYITREEADAAWEEPLKIRPDRTGAVKTAPHFTEYVREYVIENYGEEALYGGLDITTSIDLPLQKRAEQVVAKGVADIEQYGRNNGAMVVMVPWSGEVLAMVGSADFENALINGEVNYATSLIQPGSSMKPLVYAAAFEKGWNPASVIMDVPTKWENPGGAAAYEPKNYTELFYGAVPVRIALANSLNIPAVKAAEFAGVQEVMDTSERMGLVDSIQEDAGTYGISIGLGTAEVELLEHTNAYATLANNGKNVPPHPIVQIKDSQGNVLYDLNAEQIAKDSTQAINPGTAYQVTSILTDNKARELIFTQENRFGQTQTALGRPTAAKSGTTEEWRDLWTMGYTTDVAIGVWVGTSGTSDNSGLPERDGIQTAGPIWQNMMQEVHKTPEFAALLNGPDGRPLAKDFPQPPEVTRAKVCATTGHKEGRGGSTTELLVRGKEPTLACNELSEYEREELTKAIASTRKGGTRWASGAVDSIRRYSNVVGGRGVPIVEPPSNTSEDSSGNDDPPSQDDEQIIEPAD
ncbi:MAG: transglycosylase domain-containing protein [Chloroflexota bacterium]|nr:transglycosylase domain-containing protein [Chloroflexota bacterium]